MRPPGRTRPQASGLEEIAASGPFGSLADMWGFITKPQLYRRKQTFRAAQKANPSIALV
jgi:hypothetical protein